MPEYLTVSDFLANDSLLSKKIGGLRESVDAMQAQVGSLTSAFTSYVAETDAYRIANNKRLGDIDTRLDHLQNDLNDFKRAVNTELADIKQTMNRGFALLFARFGIQP